MSAAERKQRKRVYAADSTTRSWRISRLILLRGLALVHDGMMGAAAMLLSLVLRFDFDIVVRNLTDFLGAAVLFGLIVSGVGFLLGLNRGIWRYASLSDLLAITYVASASVASFTVAKFLLDRLELIPRSSIFIAWAFLIVLLAGPRAAYRLYRNRHDIARGKLARPRRRQTSCSWLEPPTTPTLS